MGRHIQDDELTGAVVMECSLGELANEIEALRRERQIQKQLNVCLLETLKAFSELYLEFTEESERRQHLYKSLLKAEREAARLRLPTWFWRPEPDKSLEEMLLWRAKYLVDEWRALPDDLWDLLKEFVADYAHQEINDHDLARIIKQAQQAEVK